MMRPVLPEGATVILPERFKCPICDETPRCRGFSNHLNRCMAKHSLNREQYEKRYQETLYSPAHQFAVKWFKLVDFDVHRFGLMDYAGLTWCHIDANSPKPSYFSLWRRPETCALLRFRDGKLDLRKSFWHFRKHLKGDLTLGIWPALDNRFTMIDLDDEHAAYRDELIDRLVDLQLFFYIVFSGKKGYQFWIFWDKQVPHEELLQLQGFLCEEIPHDRNVWPYKRSLIKLPLGLHRETKHLTCFLDANGHPFELEEQMEYCLAIRDNAVPRALSRCSLSKQMPSSDVEHPWKREDAVVACKTEERSGHVRSLQALDLCLEEGTKFEQGRHFTLFLLALHLKDNRHVPLEDAFRQLEDWSSRVSSKHAQEECLRDARSTVKRVYEKDMRFSGVCMSTLTEEEVSVIEEVCDVYISVYGPFGSDARKEDRTKLMNSVRKVARTMVALAKGHGGAFNVGQRKLAELAGMARETVGRSLKILVEDPVDEVPPDPEDHDSIFRNWDKRPRRRGGMFACEYRGSFPSYQKSAYRLKDEMLEKLGWSAHEDEEATE